MAIQFGKRMFKDGEWVEYTNADGDRCDLLVGRAGSVEFLRATEEVERPYRKLIQKERISSEKRRELNIMILAKSILMDWKGVVDENGKSIPYQPELGYEMMMNDPDMMEFVMDFAMDSSNFIDTERETAKKSSAQSNGT